MITFQNNLYHIKMKNSSYVFTGGDIPVNVYWGKQLRGEELGYLAEDGSHGSYDPAMCRYREEYGFWDSYSIMESCLKVNYPDTRQLKMIFQESSIQQLEGKECLTLSYQNQDTPLKAELVYEIYPEYDIINRYSRITNEGEDVIIENMKSASLSIPPLKDYRVKYLTGKWAAEFQVNEQQLHRGAFTIQSRTGNTGPHFNPSFALDDGTADEEKGNVWFALLGYSGNWQITFERSTFDNVRVTGGISNFDFSHTLRKGESFCTPVMTAGFAEGGFGDMSRKLHRFIHDHILPVARPGRVLYNSWEATCFDVNVESQKCLARRAADMGVELFVIDDGWFGQRHSDMAGLGDWYVNKEKFPKGLSELSSYVLSLGMDFGIWVEPESVNPDSDLYRAHPDWVYRFPRSEPLQARNQYTLNISKPKVKKYLLDFLTNLLMGNPEITFVKWDMNKAIFDVGAGCTAADKELWHHHVTTLYDIWANLRESFPSVEFETCSAGGSRVDLGILRYADQCWPSDNTDAYSRLSIQEGFSYFYPPRIMTSWVTDSSTGDRKKYCRPYSYRFHSAMMGMLGIGADISKLPLEDLKEFGEYIALYKEIRETVQYGKQYRLSSLREGCLHGVEYLKEDGSELVIFAFHQGFVFDAIPPRIYPRGLELDALYQVEGMEGLLHGDTLMYGGLSSHMDGDFESRIIRIRKAKGC